MVRVGPLAACDGGDDRDLPPGGTVDIVWDHRGYVASTAPEACSGVSGGAQCVLAVPVPATTMQEGTPSVCPTADGGGTCFGSTMEVSAH